MAEPIKSAPNTLIQSSLEKMARPLPDGHKRANPRRILFLSRALNQLRFYRRFLCEIRQELRSLFERIQVLRRNNLFRCGIGPVSTFADIPIEHATPHIRALARSQCIRRFSSIRRQASLADLQILLEGWERGVESACTWHQKALRKNSSGSGIAVSEQNTPSTPDPQESHRQDHQERT